MTRTGRVVNGEYNWGIRAMTFKEWMAEVNRRIADKLGGLTSEDLPDCNYRDWYDAGWTPREAVAEALRMATE
jgi:hypothetical protein